MLKSRRIAMSGGGMPLSESDRARVFAEVARITQEDYRESFEPIYDLAFRVMGEYPDLAAGEILNFNNHTSRAPFAESYDRASEILQQGRRHIVYGSYISLYQIMLYRNDFSDSYIRAGEQQHKRSLTDFRLEHANLKKLCSEIPKIELKREGDPRLIAADIDWLLDANKRLLIVTDRIVEFQARMAEVLQVEGRFTSAIRRVRQLIWKEIFLLGTLAITFNLIASSIYTIWGEEAVKSLKARLLNIEFTSEKPNVPPLNPNARPDE